MIKSTTKNNESSIKNKPTKSNKSMIKSTTKNNESSIKNTN